jgi:hypothetical protein
MQADNPSIEIPNTDRRKTADDSIEQTQPERSGVSLALTGDTTNLSARVSAE